MAQTKNNNREITASEWEVMRIVWTLSGATSHQLIESLSEKMAWQESTIKTLIRRLEEKGFLNREGASRPFRYQATLSEQEGINLQVDRLFDNLCAMHIGPTLIRLVQQHELSQADLATLASTITEKAPTAPETVPCNCLTNCQMTENNGGCQHDEAK
ncbi:CopY/TcrY family copper transport repressor [Lapidilactobacillus wuchangensis]|uniref:CopY/TcrY family copper transport repressor n=1 Tax=Lapidilactobacillus wuchangensis TaxID=2486001 RepID=UPI000F769A54|nr:CopY/TcrY family copper transport repressor [Lapidilactobacillus wuchangensis]